MTTTYDSSAIEVLTGLEPVRKRPGMYTVTERPNHLAQEVIDNSIDEALAGYAKTIEVTLFPDGSCEVSDDGRGMPVDIHPEEKIPGVELIMTRLHAEIARSINFYKGQQGGSPPARVLLSGGSSIIPYTDRFFKEKIQTEIEYFNPFRNVEIDPRISREELARSAHFFGEVVGLGLRKHTECPIEVDLLPNSVRTRQQMKHKRPYLAAAGVCVLLIPLCWLGYTQKTMNLTRRQLDVVTDKVNNLNDLSQKLTREQGQLAELNGKADQVVSLVLERRIQEEPVVFQAELPVRLARGLAQRHELLALGESADSDSPFLEGNWHVAGRSRVGFWN